MIREQLKNKQIAISGATGFLGTALVERLLRSVPDCQLILLVRPSRRLSAQARVEKEILKNDCFDLLRSELGDKFLDITKDRIKTIAGDVGVDGLGLSETDREILSQCDIFVHSAASVSFDSPLDSAVETAIRWGRGVLNCSATDLIVSATLTGPSKLTLTAESRGESKLTEAAEWTKMSH